MHLDQVTVRYIQILVKITRSYVQEAFFQKAVTLDFSEPAVFQKHVRYINILDDSVKEYAQDTQT